MTPYLASHSPATDTTEIILPRFSRALPEAPTQEIHLPYCKPDPAPAPRWSWLARALAAFVAVDALGLLYVVTQ